MSRAKLEIFQDLTNSVVEMDEEKAKQIAYEVLQNGIDAYEAVNEGLVKGMELVGEKFEKGIYFVPEVLIASDAMYAGLEILKPHIKIDYSLGFKGIIGAVEGDTHDIGKNLVKLMLESSGFKMIDLGRDVVLSKFVEVALETNVDLICLSTLMTTTMPGMKEVVDLLVKENVRDKFILLVGGAPVSASFAKQIGADGYAANATEAVKVAKKLLVTKKVKQQGEGGVK
jgi:corrinoid protein of di/trimethylamine methyltransferase